MRTKYAIRNILTAWTGQIFMVIFNFILRRIFVRYLDVSYLGINGLFSNILSLLSLAELGIGTAIVYSLYEPLAKEDWDKTALLMEFYRKAYCAIGVFILAAGLAVTPFLSFFVKEEKDIPHLFAYYMLFVVDTAVSYFYSYKASLIQADQKRYIVTLYSQAVKFVLLCVSMAVLALWKNFGIYLCVQVVATLLENILISRKAEQMYPFLKLSSKGKKIPKEEWNKIQKNTFSMICHKTGEILVNGTDNLLISKFVGIAAVGFYSNYMMIFNALTGILGHVFSSITAGVGNFAVTEQEQRKRKLFHQVYFMSFWIYGFCSVCIFCLCNDFIIVWVGESFTLDKFLVFVMVMNYYLTGMRKPVLTFRDAFGLFWYDRYKALIEAGVNLIVSVWLAKYFGMFGVLLGTTISTVSVCLWVEPWILFKYGMKQEKLQNYFGKFGVYGMLTLAAGILSYYLGNYIAAGQMVIVRLVIKGIICILLTNVVFLISSFGTGDFTYIRELYQKARLTNKKKYRAK